MIEREYVVKDIFGNTIAKGMNLENAIILVEALFEKYYNETHIAYTIVRIEELER